MTVQLWLADLDGPVDGLWLSEDEQARRDRFVFPIHRHRFARGRGLLRQVLTARLGHQPTFTYSRHGRPRVEGLVFNVSHSENQLLIAISDLNLGVDIEAIKLLDDQAGVARTAFSPAELAAWKGDPASFYRLWTRKEAVMKASGLGFALGSKTFTLSLEPGPQVHGPYTVLDLPAPPGYHAALAIEGPEPKLIVNTL